jgi:hypothetical protein
VKKTLIAALASLMLAGALCAMDGVIAPHSGATFVIIGDGGGPIVASSQVMSGDTLSNVDQF